MFGVRFICVGKMIKLLPPGMTLSLQLLILASLTCGMGLAAIA